MSNRDQDHDTRLLPDQSFEIRQDGKKGSTIIGYAAVFDTETDIAGMFNEKISRGAFKNALKTSDVHALYNHDYGKVLGRAKSKTLRLKEDKKGLKVEIDLPDTQDARDLAEQMKRGDIDQMSFGFRMAGGKQEWDDSKDPPVRTIIEFGEITDVSVCPRGAYPTTSCGLRSLENYRKQKNFSAVRKRLALKKDLAAKRG